MQCWMEAKIVYILTKTTLTIYVFEHVDANKVSLR